MHPLDVLQMTRWYIPSHGIEWHVILNYYIQRGTYMPHELYIKDINRVLYESPIIETGEVNGPDWTYYFCNLWMTFSWGYKSNTIISEDQSLFNCMPLTMCFSILVNERLISFLTFYQLNLNQNHMIVVRYYLIISGATKSSM